MDPRLVQEYRDLYDRHWWFEARRRIVLREARDILSEKGSARILDVGCGDGLLFPDLRELGEVEGVEPETALITERGRRRGLIHNVPFDEAFRPAGRFSLILFLDVLEHMPAPGAALRHARGLLEPSGRLLITVPAFRALWTSHDELNDHLDRYTARSFHDLARGAGIRILRHRYLFHWLFPVKLGARVAEAVLSPTPRPPRIPPRPVNQALAALTLAEEWALKPLRLPFGSSLLVVGSGVPT